MINSTQFLRHNSADSSETGDRAKWGAEENDKDVFLTEARLGRCLGPVKETSLPLITASHTKNHFQAKVECLNVKLGGIFYLLSCRLSVMKVSPSDMESSKKVCLFWPLIVPRFAVPAHRLLAGQRSSEGLNISWMGAVKSAARWDLQIRYTIFMSNLSF